MKIVKISLLGCPPCITMNNVFNKIKDEYSFEYEEMEYNLEAMQKYDLGVELPIYIFIYEGKEIARLCGEHSKEDFDEILKKY